MNTLEFKGTLDVTQSCREELNSALRAVAKYAEPNYKVWLDTNRLKVTCGGRTMWEELVRKHQLVELGVMFKHDSNKLSFS